MAETPAETLAQELRILDIPTTATRGSGWLKRCYLGGRMSTFNSGSCHKVTIFLIDKYATTKHKNLSMREWLKLLDDTEAIYPKYRA